jgi:rfaE bifunctional protein nucleotidyltransferase chain/domain
MNLRLASDHATWEKIDRTIVLCHGCFDLLHLGHIRHLREAKALGTYLVVSITPDAHVKKGIQRPVFSAEQRLEAIRALACVDDAFINDGEDATSAIDKVKPSIYVKGEDYAQRDSDDPALAREIAAVTAHGGTFHTTRSQRWSSSRIINEQRLSDDLLRFIERARALGFHDKIRQAFERADQRSIAFVGETILDEYCYVSPLAKPSKEFMLATVTSRESECFLGGVVAASKHADWPNTELITVHEGPLLKTIFVDSDFSRKLFEVYSRTGINLDSHRRERFQNELSTAVHDCDVIVVLDFGHGLMGEQERGITEASNFLALNAQTNAGNHGFNPVTRYLVADYVCIDEGEARLASGKQDDPCESLPHAVSVRMKNAGVIVTRGRNGSATRFGQIPAIASHGGTDTMGAGDAFLAVTAPLIAAGLDLEAAAFVGNVAGAIKLEIVGHRSHVGRAELMQTIDALLK